MDVQISIRKFNKSDWETYATFWLQALRECPGVFGSSLAIEEKYTPDKWQNLCASKSRAMFGLFDGEEIIGITGAVTDRNDSQRGILIASYIKPHYRGRGFSDFLYRARIDWAKDNTEWRKLIVGHRDGNEASRRANQRHGFIFTHREPYDWPDGANDDYLYYELDLERLRQEE